MLHFCSSLSVNIHVGIYRKIHLVYTQLFDSLSLGKKAEFTILVVLKEKNKYHILTDICGIYKNGSEEPVYKTERETEIQRTNVWTPQVEEGAQ